MEMLISFFFFLNKIYCLKRNVPIVSLFCLHADSSFSKICEDIKNQYNNIDKLISKYEVLLNNATLTIESHSNLSSLAISMYKERITTYQNMIDFLKYMGAPKSSEFPNEISDIEKTTEILYIFQYGSMNLKKVFDFTKLKNSMIVDISTSNIVQADIEIFTLIASRLGLDDQISSILNFHGFLDFLNYKKYAFKHKKLINNINYTNIHQNNTDSDSILKFIDEKYQEYISSDFSMVGYNDFSKKSSSSTYLAANDSPLVIIRGEDGGKVKFLTVSRCTLLIKKENIKIKSIAFLDDVSISKTSMSISTDYVLASSSYFLNNQRRSTDINSFIAKKDKLKKMKGIISKADSSQGNNEFFTYTFKKFAIWSANNENGPCKFNFSKKAVKISYGRPNSSFCSINNNSSNLVQSDPAPPRPSLVRSAEFQIPYSVVTQQLSFIAPLSSNVILNVINFDEEDDYEPPITPAPTPTPSRSPELRLCPYINMVRGDNL